MTRRRVVHVVRSDAFAGVERYVASVASELHRRGWAVAVIGGEAARMRMELPPDIAYKSARTVGQVGRALWSTGSAAIVHAHMTAAELPAAILKRRSGGRLIVTRHFAGPRGASAMGGLARPLIGRRVDAQISISRFVADMIGEPSIMLHNGVPPSTRTPGGRSRTVVMMNRLQPEKDPTTALRAWAASGLAAKRWKLAIYGRGEGERELRRLSNELRLDDSVQFAGVSSQPRRVLAEAAVMLAPAPAEPFGLAVVEAMAEGTPVLAARGGGHIETLGNIGTYFEPHDVAGCASALQALAASEDLRVHLGRELRRRHAEMFTLHRHVDALEKVYTERIASSAYYGARRMP